MQIWIDTEDSLKIAKVNVTNKAVRGAKGMVSVKKRKGKVNNGRD